MLSLHNFSIRLRFYLVLACVSLSLLVLGGWGWVSGVQANQSTADLFTRANAAAADVAVLRESLGLVRRWESSAIAIGTSNADQVHALIGRWKAEVQKVQQVGAKIRQANPADAEIAKLVANQDRLMQDYAATMGPALEQLESAVIDSLSALVFSTKVDKSFQALGDNTLRLIAAQQEAAVRAHQQMQAQSTAASLLRLGLVGLTLLLFVPLMWLTLQSICRPLDHAVALARRIAIGDLGQTIVVQGRDETAQLLRALDAMQASLRTVVGEVRDSAESIKAASAEVASGNQDLSQRTEQAASNLQGTASSLSDLTGTVGQSARSARQANQLASSAAEVAARGGTVVAQVVATMDEINHSSRKIADIISVIDSIAFQTNILALNAAVEAARAGEQGRGFAVVAAEVRNLATRSAQAAREIKQLIDASFNRVEAGSRLVSSAGSTMRDIVDSVQRVTDIISEITAAAAEQSVGIERVNTAVGELDEMTQQNAALVEQSAAAADSLKGQADKLAQVVGTFRLGALRLA
nr:methyl-accepting chemotaxis protein [uncultured Albidiferax sp.]